jgi:hypothetical protein
MFANFGIGALGALPTVPSAEVKNRARYVRQRNALPAVSGAAIVAMKVIKATTIR